MKTSESTSSGALLSDHETQYIFANSRSVHTKDFGPRTRIDVAPTQITVRQESKTRATIEQQHLLDQRQIWAGATPDHKKKITDDFKRQAFVIGKWRYEFVNNSST